MLDRTPPSDEVMCKVIAEMMGWSRCDYSAPFEDEPSAVGLFALGQDIQRDPRHDTDAALKLLHHILTITKSGFLTTTYCWCISTWNTYKEFPISGEPFRTAVCNLAVEVLGVK